MQLTPYLLSSRAAAHPEKVLLFATRTGALVLLDDDDFQAISKGEIPAEFRVPLTEMGFLVEDEDNERKEIQNYLNEINSLNPNLKLDIVLGMECNFACRYCFEGEQKGKKSMSDATEAKIIDFIKTRFGPEKKKLKIAFYGGEPLLYKKRIISIAEQLKPWIESRGGEFEFTLVSNGSLLTAKTVAQLNPLGLDGVKVTVDGPPANHNHFRPFKNGEPSFEIIAKNLKEVCTLTKIRLGGNYTSENFHEFPTVLDLLKDKGITPDRIDVVNFNIVIQVKDKITNNQYHGGCCTVNEPWVKEAALHIREEVYKRDFTIPEIGPMPCAVEVDDAFTINYDGSLYKCITWIGHEQFKLGDVEKGVDPTNLKNHHVGHWQREEKCKTCEYLPLCFGGCRFMAYQRDGHMAKVDCQKPFLDATLKEMLLQDLKYRTGRPGD